MTTNVASVGAWSAGMVAFGVLLLAGIGHLRRGGLGQFLRQQSFLPEHLSNLVGFALPKWEIVVGIGGTLALLFGIATSFIGGMACATYLGFMLYLVALRKLRPDSECGCFQEPLGSGGALLRAGGLFAASALFLGVKPDPLVEANAFITATVVGTAALVVLIGRSTILTRLPIHVAQRGAG